MLSLDEQADVVVTSKRKKEKKKGPQLSEKSDTSTQFAAHVYAY